MYYYVHVKVFLSTCVQMGFTCQLRFAAQFDQEITKDYTLWNSKNGGTLLSNENQNALVLVCGLLSPPRAELILKDKVTPRHTYTNDFEQSATTWAEFY